jgi:adenylate cyclase
VVFAVLHALDIVHVGVLKRLDDIIYDARLVATMPSTLDDRIVIIDIDEKSLAELGHWPWSRNKLAKMVDLLFERYEIGVLGFDVVFAEPDDTSGLDKLNALARSELKDQTGFLEKLKGLQTELDYDGLFAKALENRPIVMGYYLTSDAGKRTSGVLPAPLLSKGDFPGRVIDAMSRAGYGSNIDRLAKSAPLGGFFNAITSADGVVRSYAMVEEYHGEYYESLALAMFRVITGLPPVSLGFSEEKFLSRRHQGLESVRLHVGEKRLAIPVGEMVASLIPYRGHGGVTAGSFKYISASDVIAQKVDIEALRGKIVLVGTTAAGLQDLRTTPVDEVYPGVEVHANVISALIDQRLPIFPDWAPGYDLAFLLVAGFVLAFGLPLLSAVRAIGLSFFVFATVVGANTWFFLGLGVVLPLAAALTMTVTAFALNMSYGYFVESRSKRELANLFGTYVPPELVDEMVKDPDSYSMKAANRELTVMFCDMRGFTKMSERMEPIQLQELLNGVFSRLTSIIRSNRGTIDKYMGDCVMAFWGAPVETTEHAHLAVKSAMEMANAVQDINQEHRERGLPDIGIGIGLNTGSMCVGDMGSNIRRSYTVIGDAVNLGSRLEGLSKVYGVETVVSESTKLLAPEIAWQELDLVRVKGKELAVAIFWPVATLETLSPEANSELKTWSNFLKSYRAQDWDQADVQLLNLLRMNPKKYLYQVYAERVASMRLLPFDPEWDGATNFETK